MCIDTLFKCIINLSLICTIYKVNNIIKILLKTNYFLLSNLNTCFLKMAYKSLILVNIF